MSKICQKCKKSIGFFSNGGTCSHPDCDISECGDCEGKVLKPCAKCQMTYCIKHISNHPCQELDENSEESSSEEEIEVGQDKTGKWRWFSHTDYENEDVAAQIDELEAKGFEFQFVAGDQIFMKRKGERK